VPSSGRFPLLSPDVPGGPPPVTARMRRRDFALPPIPAVAAHLLSLLAREHVGLADVSATIAADPAVTAEVLRAANSARFGLRGEVTDVRHAATLLGLDRLRGLAAAVGLRRYLGGTVAAPAVLRTWRHGLACALVAEQLAVRCGGHAGEAYTAGLMHDLGRLALIVAHPTIYPAFLDSPQAAGPGHLEAERDRFEMDHCEAGRWLAAQLLLPQAFQDVALHHHTPQAVGPTDLLVRVAVACRLADHLGYWVVRPPHHDAAPADASELIDHLLSPLPLAHRVTIVSDLAEIAVEVAAQVDDVGELLVP
jgi:HD-like signal output (HDOD) protein